MASLHHVNDVLFLHIKKKLFMVFEMLFFFNINFIKTTIEA